MRIKNSRVLAPVVFLLISLALLSGFLLWPSGSGGRLRLNSGDVTAELQDAACRENRLTAMVVITLPPDQAEDGDGGAEKTRMDTLRAEYAPTVAYGAVTRAVPIRKTSLWMEEGQGAVFTMEIDEFLTLSPPQAGDVIKISLPGFSEPFLLRV